MTNKFWFYFFGIPVLFGLLCFSVPISFKITNEVSVFEDALDHCKNEDNNRDILKFSLYSSEFKDATSAEAIKN